MIISIVTPVLNGGDYLRACIRLVKADRPCGVLVETRPRAHYRRGGRNHSIVHKGRATHEARAIQQSLSLNDDPLRHCALRAWVNLHNPGWRRHKLIEWVRLQLGMAYQVRA